MWTAPKDRKQTGQEYWDIQFANRKGCHKEPDESLKERISDEMGLIGPVAGLVVLSLGSGALLWQELMVAKECLMVDVSQEACNQVEEFSSGVIKTVRQDVMEFLRGNARRFDVVSSFGLIECLPPGTLTEFVRLMPADAVAFGTSVGENYVVQSDYRLVSYTREEILSAFAEHGFEPVKMLPFPSHVWARFERSSQVVVENPYL